MSEQSDKEETQGEPTLLPCNCGGVACDGETFDCMTCGRKTPNCRGAADNMPDSCDECWAEANKK